MEPVENNELASRKALATTTNLSTSLPSTWLRSVGRHVGDIILHAFLLMKKPLSSILATILVTTLLLAIFTHVLRVAHTNIKGMELCGFPIVSRLPLCNPSVTSLHPPPSPLRADFPGLMDIQHRALDELTTKAGVGSELALNIKHAELAVRDLIIVIQSSELPIKDVLSATLVDFIADARQSARGLQVLSSKVHGTLDSIVAFNTHAFRAIESAKSSSEPSPASAGDIERAVVRTFQTSLAWFTSSISAIIVDASAVAASLDRLDERLATAHSLCMREEFDNALALDDLLWELWTRLGGNRSKVRELKNRASILKNVQRYRNVAVAYVAGTMQMLSVIDAELSELRDRLSASSFEEYRIPVEVQLASIESSIRRLREGSLSGGLGGGRLGLGNGE